MFTIKEGETSLSDTSFTISIDCSKRVVKEKSHFRIRFCPVTATPFTLVKKVNANVNVFFDVNVELKLPISFVYCEPPSSDGLFLRVNRDVCVVTESIDKDQLPPDPPAPDSPPPERPHGKMRRLSIKDRVRTHHVLGYVHTTC